jgi:hypothetical protein
MLLLCVLALIVYVVYRARSSFTQPISAQLKHEYNDL